MNRAASQLLRESLSLYEAGLVESIAARLAKYATPAQKKLEPAERMGKVLSSAKSVAKIVAGLHEAERHALAILTRAAAIPLRWDHAIRLLSACSVPSPYTVLQSLLAQGLAMLRPPRPEETIARFEFADGMPPAGLPEIGIVLPFREWKLDLPAPIEAPAGHERAQGWRVADGWEMPIRLAALWRIAWQAPIKRTLQNTLFKRDAERLLEDPVLGAPLLDAPANLPQPGLLAFEAATGLGWLAADEDAYGPADSLVRLVGDDPFTLLKRIAARLLVVEEWNEIDLPAAARSFAQEAASARLLLLLWLDGLKGEEGAAIETLAERLRFAHAPFHGPPEAVGHFRQPEARARLARDWATSFLLGPMYQCGIIAVHTLGPEGALVRLTPLGRQLLGEQRDLEPPPTFPRTLLVQPNLQIIVYRQGLNLELLSRLFVFAEPRTLGAALTFEITAESIYRGLESGMTGEEICEILAAHGGRELPSGLVESIRTWAQKRDRISVYADVALLEFGQPRDLDEALARGVVGSRITDRLLVVEGELAKSYQNLRITSSRDYRFAGEPCIELAPDGVTMMIDPSKADLMLETELRRFAEPAFNGQRSDRRVYRVTSESLAEALGQGLRIGALEEWYQTRTGAPPPPSVQLLCRAAAGLEVAGESLFVLSTDSSLLAEGLLQHPETAPYLSQRLGPTSLVVSEEKLRGLRAALDRLGVSLAQPQRAAAPVEGSADETYT